MMIKREKYLEEIRKVMGKQVIKVLLGMRRVGKSTLLLQIQEELLSQGVEKDQIISLNFEWLEFEPLKEYKTLYEYIESKKIEGKKTYVFLDEVQEVEGFEKVANSLNSKGDTEVFITGSNSKLLSGELATYLTGRFYTIEVLPLSYREVYEGFTNFDVGLSTKESVFLDYLKTGGMPGKFQFEEERTAKNYLMDMYQSILLRDIVKRYNVRDVDLLQRFMLYLIHNIGQIFSAITITNYLKSEGRKLSKETIYNHIEAAKSTYLVHGVPRYNIKGKELIKTNEKYFINDLGIRNLYFDNEKDIGQALENVVYLELRRRNYEIYVGKFDDKEVDFIAIDGDTTKYIQVTYLLAEESTIEREFSVLESIEDNFPKMVISMDRVNRSRNGIEHKNIIDFLLED
ncbi:ATP-binding protein [Fusibacter tunisiensis]|uniref:AAA+ superfamily ATPase n=1 Tax=Fusibacter tunisiensis TaxID=1008308 RepID=A0ABS2MT27_9FIRM|nr:ATP-binding protein [Fusibacter tunisiensis]MBM7562527.1 putative AAA+ superfamily ATPase [Fusibacter tunisiensis]